MSESWTKIGKSWDPSLFQKKESPKIKEKEESKPKKDKQHKKHKKHEKEKQKEKQVAVKYTEEEIDAFYDKLNEEKCLNYELYNPLENRLQHIDPNEGFIFKHELGSGLLSIQIIRFGFQDIYLYGHLQKEIPSYKRIDQNLIIGLVSDQNTQELLLSIGIPILQQYTFMKQKAPPTRYMDIDFAGDGVDFKITAIKNQKPEDFMRFSMQLNSSQDQYQMIKEQKIIQQAKDIQNKLDQNADDLESWKQILALQERIAEFQNYNEETIVAQRKLAIIEKLEKSSEVLADHPWVLAQKIFIMQNLQIKDEEFEGQIAALWETLFSKYVHIQPIWILYLDHKLKSDKFNATALRLGAQQSIQTLKIIIQDSNRPQFITHYKKIYLELLQQICFYESEMGFKERALGIYQSLAELNIFAPNIYQRTSEIEEKFEAFRQYWEEYRNFKTGDLQSKCGWKDQQNKNLIKYTSYQNEQNIYENTEFVGLFGEQKIQELTCENPFQQYIMRQKFVKQRWRPSNLTYDQEYIQSNMDSLVLYEDLQNYLHTFNDIESKLNIISSQLEQLGYPSFFQQQMNSFYMAQVCYFEIKKQLESKHTSDENLMVHDLFTKYMYMFQKFDTEVKQSEIEKLIYIRRLLMHLNNFIQNEITLSYYLMIEGLISLNKEKLLTFYQSGSIQAQEIDGAQNRIKLLLKQYGEKYFIIWIIFAELEVRRTKKEEFMEKIYNQIFQFGKSKKQKLIILYFYAQSYLIRKNYKKLEDVLKKNLQVLLNDSNEVSLNLMKIKIRNEYLKERSKNKIQILEKLEKQKHKQFSIFNVNKKFLLQNLILMLEFVNMGQNTTIPAQQEIDSHLTEIELDYNIVKNIFFQDPETKQSNLTRQQNIVSLMLTNFLRYVDSSGYSKEIVDDICKKISSIGLKNNANSLIFYKMIVTLFQEKGVYFLKFQQTKTKIIEVMNDLNFFQSTQVAWMILILLQNADKHEDPLMFKSKLGYLYDFLKQQSKKEVSQIYCESKDQEMFEAFINIVYNFYLERILTYVAKYIMSVDKYIQLTYRAIKKFPFSITLYNKLLKELTSDQQESLKILNVIEEKELKTFSLE